MLARNPLSTISLIAWLEQQDAETTYCYSNTGECLAAQYNKFIGRKYEWINLTDPNDRLPFDIALEQIACDTPRTYGAALERARALV